MPLALGVIPARYASTRFPGKPLAPLGTRTLVEQVWRRAAAARSLERVIIATDDRRIEEAARAFGADVRITSPEHPSGTDRVAEVLQGLQASGESYDIVVNIQGDEPLVTSTILDAMVAAFDVTTPPDIVTLSEPIRDADELFDPNVVKLVAAPDGRVLYFSRSPIPYHRASAARISADFRPALEQRPGGLGGYRKHPGIYAYRTPALLELTSLPPSALERDEGLEQLRALEAGMVIRALESDFRSQGVDTPADLDRVAELLGGTR